jgi:drug/metabolite transporter superfamily protein YnfA
VGLRSVWWLVVAALAEIGGSWLVWQGVREHRGVAFVGAGVIASGAYGFVGDVAAGRELRSDPCRVRRDLRRGLTRSGSGR